MSDEEKDEFLEAMQILRSKMSKAGAIEVAERRHKRISKFMKDMEELRRECLKDLESMDYGFY